MKHLPRIIYLLSHFLYETNVFFSKITPYCSHPLVEDICGAPEIIPDKIEQQHM